MILVVLVVGILVSILYSSRTSAVNHKARILRVKDLLRASIQWHSAAKQDTNIVEALLHSSRSVAYLEAARVLMSDEDIEEFHEDISSFVQKVETFYTRCVHSAKLRLKDSV